MPAQGTMRDHRMSDPKYPQHVSGVCPICEKPVVFILWGPDFRNQFLCDQCLNYSVPRERALAVALNRYYPNFRDLSIHESSPVDRGISAVMKRQCRDYVATQFYPGVEAGAFRDGFQNQNLEHTTFPYSRFDLVITQDVMEHVDDIAAAFRDIGRTLKPGGAHIFTTPTYIQHKTLQWATYRDGKIHWFHEAEFHGNPVDERGAPVTYHFGYDFLELIYQWTAMPTEVIRMHDPGRGIAGPMTEVYITRKPESAEVAPGDRA
jgi:SAM-dependent methyltransferase